MIHVDLMLQFFLMYRDIHLIPIQTIRQSVWINTHLPKHIIQFRCMVVTVHVIFMNKFCFNLRFRIILVFGWWCRWDKIKRWLLNSLSPRIINILLTVTNVEIKKLPMMNIKVICLLNRFYRGSSFSNCQWEIFSI